MLSDRDIENWNVRLLNQLQQGWDNYAITRIDLGLMRNNYPLRLPGEFFFVKDISAPAATATVRFNDHNNKQIDLEKNTIVKTIFSCLYVTNAVQAGAWIDIIVGINFEYYRDHRGEAQPCIIITNALSDTNTQGADHRCERVLVRAFTTNTGLVWLNQQAAAAENSCYPLAPGDAKSMRLSNTNLINCLFKVANEKVCVTYEA